MSFTLMLTVPAGCLPCCDPAPYCPDPASTIEVVFSGIDYTSPYDPDWEPNQSYTLTWEEGFGGWYYNWTVGETFYGYVLLSCTDGMVYVSYYTDEVVSIFLVGAEPWESGGAANGQAEGGTVTWTEIPPP